MNCCPELISRLMRLQSDMTTLKDTDIPRIEEHFDNRLDGLIECFDFPRNSPGQTLVIGSGLAGSVRVPPRALWILVTAISPTPSNRSKRQDGNGTPDVIQGGWCWFSVANGLGERLPLDAEQKTIPVPIEYRSAPNLSLAWCGANGIQYELKCLVSEESKNPPYEERPCQN